MTRRLALEFALLFFATVAVSPTTSLSAQNFAPSPPMGWNEWDAYGMTITEADFMANARVLSGLKQYGWQYAMIDAGWYIENPATANPEAKSYVLDGDGRLTPAESRFSSAAGGKGFKPLADLLHGQGLKLVSM